MTVSAGSVLGAKIASMCILGGLSLVAGLLPIKIVKKFGLTNLDKQGKSDKAQYALTALSCFGAGVILTTCFTHVLPEVNEMLKMSYKEGTLIKPKGVPLGEIILLVGFFKIYLIEEIAQILLQKFRNQEKAKDEALGELQACPPNNNPCGNELGQIKEVQKELPKDAGALAWCKCDKEPSFQVALRGFFIILAISLHAIFEGVAMGLGTKASFVWYLCFAVAVHKSIIAFCIGVQMTTSGVKRTLIYAYMTTFSLVTPIGIAIGITLIETTTKTSSHGSSASAAILNGLAAGTLIYVVFFEILEKERQRKSNGLVQVVFIILGFLVMIIIQLIEGDHHHHGKNHAMKAALTDSVTDSLTDSLTDSVITDSITDQS